MAEKATTAAEYKAMETEIVPMPSGATFEILQAPEMDVILGYTAKLQEQHKKVEAFKERKKKGKRKVKLNKAEKERFEAEFEEINTREIQEIALGLIQQPDHIKDWADLHGPDQPFMFVRAADAIVLMQESLKSPDSDTFRSDAGGAGPSSD